MKINQLPEHVLAATSGKSTPKAQAKKAEGSAAPEASVNVRLSNVTQTMTQGVARSGTDVFNAEKVQAMRTAIENGSFSVNPEAIADKMLNNAREMLRVVSSS